ncbi:hypothetical protein LTR37_001115 [Vermiconidia calcicola]|uniref:Uncharacterized protein n=1 Tax=Vermiconidia calcicola TaxID=1690605 RepID=A0ACC3NX50_9PEZI|nr:hypothetical protein LTR37_001115 [Vermiconidia calcicola]
MSNRRGVARKAKKELPVGEEESDLEKSAGEEEAGGEASRGEGAVPVEEDDAPPAKRQRRSLGATATNHDALEASTEPKRKSTCHNCNRPASRLRPGATPTERLCDTCYRRLKTAQKATPEGEPVSDDWRRALYASRKTEAKDALCQNPQCRLPATAEGLQPGPGTERLCNPCYVRWRRALNKLKPGEVLIEDWRQPQQGGPPRGGKRAKPMDPVVKPVDAERTLLQTHHTLPMLLDLTRRSWHASREHWNPSVENEQPQQSRSNYWTSSKLQLSAEIVRRGIVGLTMNGLRRIINVLQIHDALNGLFPIPRPADASVYHNMYQDNLVRLGTERGYFRQQGDKTRDSQSIVDFLIEQDRDAPGPSAAFNEALDAETAILAAQILLDDLSLALGYTASTPLFGASNPDVPHGTHNRGIFGSHEALNSLGQTLMRNQFPTETPSRGLRCGVEALARSMRATRSDRYQHDLMREPSRHITGDEMMQLLFTDFVPDEVANPGTTATPTPAYAAYIENAIRHLRDEDIVLYNEYYHIYTARNNLNIQQLIAVIELLRNSGQIEDDFGLGVVVGTHRHLGGDGVMVDHQANARIVHPGRNSAPVLWIHHNVAVGAGEYNHFEGFEMGGRINTNVEWGMRMGDTSLLPRYKVIRQDPAADSSMSKLDRFRHDYERAKNTLNTFKAAMTKACLPCRKKEATDCERLKGKKHCNNCEPKDCKWPEGTQEFPTIHVGASTYTAEERVEWDTPAHNIDELFELAKKCLPNVLPTATTGKHFWAIFSARMSRHQGMARFHQILASLVQTQHYYDVMLNQPNPQGHDEYNRPAGPGTPMFAHSQVLARHGNKMIPTHTGNIQDPYLIAFVNLMNFILNPANPLPEELHIVTLGIAGFQVDIDAWGDRAQGFFGHVLAHRPALAMRIYVVPLAEAPVVNGVGNESLDGPVRGAPAPHPNAPFWLLYRNKYLQKVKLVDLVDRRHTRKTTAVNNIIRARQQPPQPPMPVPAWSAARGGAAMEDKLDRLLDAMYDEKAFRAGYTDNTTNPSTQQMVARNNLRNLGMR